MSRNPFAFLSTLTREDQLLTLLQAIVIKSGGEVTLSVSDLTDLDTGDALFTNPNDKGDSLMVRFARKGATAYFKPAEEPVSQPARTRSVPRQQAEESSPVIRRNSVHSDLDIALMEEEREQQMGKRAREQELQRRAETGVYPWVERKPS